MVHISVVVCTHNPRPDALRRTLDSLKGQSLRREQWDLLIVDNACDNRLSDTCDLSWHERARHVREEKLGLTLARLRGIADADGELLVFVDDDNVLAPGFLEEAWDICSRYPYLGAFGAGNLEPEFEIQPPPEVRPRSPSEASPSRGGATTSETVNQFPGARDFASVVKRPTHSDFLLTVLGPRSRQCWVVGVGNCSPERTTCSRGFHRHSASVSASFRNCG